jgi:hypothetical protein
MKKIVFSFWCTNKRHTCDQYRQMQCCFCEHDDKDWQHFLTCPGTGATIHINASFDRLKLKQNQFTVEDDIWSAIEHGINFFHIYQEREGSPRNIPQFPGTPLPRNILIKDNKTSLMLSKDQLSPRYGSNPYDNGILEMTNPKKMKR